MRNKILLFLGFDVVVNVEPFFEDLRVIQRGKKQILQRFIENTWYDGAHWEDIKIVKL